MKLEGTVKEVLMALEPQARALVEMVKMSRMLRLLLASTVLAWLLTCMSGAWRRFPSHSFLHDLH
jgi:hypothetical protein